MEAPEIAATMRPAITDSRIPIDYPSSSTESDVPPNVDGGERRDRAIARYPSARVPLLGVIHDRLERV
jgi:hypothetical protein